MTRAGHRKLVPAPEGGLATPRTAPELPTGFDPTAAGKHRWSGVLPSFKAPRGGPPRCIYPSALEARLVLELERLPISETAGPLVGHPRRPRRSVREAP